MEFYDIQAEAQELVEKVLKTGTMWAAQKLNLDARIGDLVVGESWIATQDPSRLDYYGGFEYISSEHRLTLGDTTFYSRESDRVDGALSYLEYHQD